MTDRDYVQRAAHMMWLQRQLAAHRRWQHFLMLGWLGSIAAVMILFAVVLPFLQSILALPQEVVGVMAAGVGVELLLLFYLTCKVWMRRRALEAEISLISHNHLNQ